jgi:hypothetical protein
MATLKIKGLKILHVNKNAHYFTINLNFIRTSFGLLTVFKLALV